jgi:flagellar basal body-associated protein FliL
LRAKLRRPDEVKLIVIMVGALLLLGGGGVAAWWFLMTEPPEEEQVAEDVPLGADAKFLEIRDLDVPVFEKGIVVQRINFKLVLDLTEDADPRALKKDMPRIRDSIYSELHALYGLRYVRETDNPLPLIKRRIREATDRALGEHVVADVLVQDVNIRRITTFNRYELKDRNRDTREMRRLTQ